MVQRKLKICCDCKQSIDKPHGAQKRCSGCQIEYRRLSRKQKLKDNNKCNDCGKEVEETFQLKLRCDECDRIYVDKLKNQNKEVEVIRFEGDKVESNKEGDKKDKDKEDDNICNKFDIILSERHMRLKDTSRELLTIDKVFLDECIKYDENREVISELNNNINVNKRLIRELEESNKDIEREVVKLKEKNNKIEEMMVNSKNKRSQYLSDLYKLFNISN